MVKFPAEQIGLDTSEKKQQRAEEKSKQEKTSDVSPKQPTSGDRSDGANPQGYVFGTCDEGQAKGGSEKKEVVPASLKPDERVNPAAGTENND